MSVLKRLVCMVRGHEYVALDINGRFSGRESCARCGAAWWKGRRTR